MSIKQLTRDNFYSGVYAYAIVEEVVLGLATVRLVKNGARLTSLPVIGGQVLIGDKVIVDYSSNIPPVVRPIDEHPYYDEEEFEFALALPMLLPDETLEEPAVYFKGGDHGAQVFSFGGLILAGDPVYWNQVQYDTDDFYSPLQPWIDIPAPGLYYFVADVGWPPAGAPAGHKRPGEWWYQSAGVDPGWRWLPAFFQLDTHIDLRAEIASADIGTIGEDITHPIPRTQGNKYHSIIGQAPLLAGDRVALNLTVAGIDGLHLVQEYGLCPRLTVQWLGNINEELA